MQLGSGQRPVEAGRRQRAVVARPQLDTVTGPARRAFGDQLDEHIGDLLGLKHAGRGGRALGGQVRPDHRRIRGTHPQ